MAKVNQRMFEQDRRMELRLRLAAKRAENSETIKNRKIAFLRKVSREIKNIKPRI